MPNDFATILVMEGNVDYATLIRRTFVSAGHRVIFAPDHPTAFARCSENQIALALIDISAPRWDGVATSLALQGVGGIPVIALVQIEMTRQHIRFLIEEAREYITKPFTSNELFSRAAPFLRHWRHERQPDTLIRAGGLTLNNANARLWIHDQSVLLTPNECRLLRCFMQRPNQTLHKTELVLALWGTHFHNEENTLRVLVRRLRKKIEQDLSRPTRLLTVQGVGYRLQTDSHLSDVRMPPAESSHPTLPISQEILQNAPSLMAGG